MRFHRPARSALASAILLLAVAAFVPQDANAKPDASAGNSQTVPPKPACKTVKPKTAVSPDEWVCSPSTAAQNASIELKQIWQPPGGDIGFVLRTPSAIPAEATTRVFFRWLKIGSDPDWVMSQSVKVVTQEADGTRNMTAMVPDMPNPPSWEEGYFSLKLVPRAFLRVVVWSKDGALLVDESREVGVTGIPMAMTITAIFLALIILGLWYASRNAGKGGVFLRIITNKDGWASLSQFQMLLWTIVVAASAIYVMALSGVLIDVPNGMLVLLGISGVATVGALVQDANTAAPVQNTNPAQWSDILKGNDGIEVARVQMLIFTLISAVFVLIKIVSSYALPDIPAGILILMGISNGVYLGSKVAKG